MTKAVKSANEYNAERASLVGVSEPLTWDECARLDAIFAARTSHTVKVEALRELKRAVQERSRGTYKEET